jgi:hypothetical protein
VSTTVDTSTTVKSFMSNKMYDILHFIAMILLPAGGAAYFALAQLWHLPAGIEVVGTIAIIDTFLGAVLGFSSAQYNAGSGTVGQMSVDTTDPNAFKLHLELTNTIQEIAGMKSITFTVAPTNTGVTPVSVSTTPTDTSADTSASQV